MPLKFWDEAFLTAVYLINILPSRVIKNETPTERLLHVKPDYAPLRVFGCACWPNLRPYNNRKLMFCSKQCVFLGYSVQHKWVKCLDVSTGRVYISQDVAFDETQFPFATLHPNAGALLRKEILLLPSSLSNGANGEENNCDDQYLPNPPNFIPELCVSAINSERNSANGAENGVQNGATVQHFMCTESPGGSSSGSPPLPCDPPRDPPNAYCRRPACSAPIFFGIGVTNWATAWPPRLSTRGPAQPTGGLRVPPSCA